MGVLWIYASVLYLLAVKTTAECTNDDIISDLIAEISSMKNLVRENEDFYANKLIAMETRLQDVERKLKTAEQNITALTVQYEGSDHLTTGHVNQTGPVPSLTRRLPSLVYRIAFTSYMSAHSSVNQQVIPFDRILLNEGGAFNTVNYHFTCPVYGTYVFQSAVMADKYGTTQTEIVKNGAGLVTQYSAGSTASHGFDQGFNSVITQCSKGDRVWVQIYGDYTGTVFSSRYSTFSGFLLWEM